MYGQILHFLLLCGFDSHQSQVSVGVTPVSDESVLYCCASNDVSASLPVLQLV